MMTKAQCSKSSIARSDLYFFYEIYFEHFEDECFYTAAWGCLHGDPWLAVAGMRGTIRVINLNRGEVTRHFLGHGSSINELKFHHVHMELLTSASKDRSLISWNVLTEVQ